MTDSNPFDDLADEPADDVDGNGDDDTGVTGAEQTEPASGGGQSDASDSGASESGTGSVDGPSLPNSSPPFPYSEAEQKQMYVRDGFWEEFEDLGFDAELELRRRFDVRNVEQRELDTAVIRLALEQLTAEEIAESVVRMRGFDPTDAE